MDEHVSHMRCAFFLAIVAKTRLQYQELVFFYMMAYPVFNDIPAAVRNIEQVILIHDTVRVKDPLLSLIHIYLLTLDYPSMERDDGLCGIDKIYQYISGLCIEKRFLGIFERSAVAGLLQRTMTDYELIYFDNICYQVLLLSLGCMIAEEPVARLKVSGEGLNAVREFFDGTDSESAENKISGLIVMLTGRLGDEEMKEYFLKTSHEYAVRIMNAAGVNGLSGVFP